MTEETYRRLMLKHAKAQLDALFGIHVAIASLKKERPERAIDIVEDYWRKMKVDSPEKETDEALKEKEFKKSDYIPNSIEEW